MAIDPATLKIISKVATTVLTDEKGRKAVLIACLIPLIIILLILSSPFAIFFALVGGQNESVSVVSTMYELKEAFQYSLQLEQEDTSANVIHTIVMGSEEGTIIDNSEDVLIAFAIKYNMIEENSEQMAVLSEEQVANLRQVYQDMNSISIFVETVSEDVEVTTTNENGETEITIQTISKNIKTIYVDCLTAEEVAEIYGFNDLQKLVITEMRQSGYGLLVSTNNSKTFLTREEIEKIKSYLPAGMNIEREDVVSTAQSIVGQVPYFWGGKSLAMGWDSRWGTEMEVTSPGSSSTGTLEPFGLDCSGYVTWVFANMGLPTDTIEQTIGHGTTAQWNSSSSIPQSIVEPADLAFIAVPGTRKVNHIGIVVGKDDEGNILVAHCTSGADNVVITTASSAGFMYYRRPAVLIN